MWSSVWSEVQTVCSCHCHPQTPSSLASLVLPFWYRLIQVVPEKRSLNRCSSKPSSNSRDLDDERMLERTERVEIIAAVVQHLVLELASRHPSDNLSASILDDQVPVQVIMPALVLNSCTQRRIGGMYERQLKVIIIIIILTTAMFMVLSS